MYEYINIESFCNEAFVVSGNYLNLVRNTKTKMSLKGQISYLRCIFVQGVHKNGGDWG